VAVWFSHRQPRFDHQQHDCVVKTVAICVEGYHGLCVYVCGHYSVCLLKASTVFESADTGDILCAVCPHAKLFVTAGTSSVTFSHSLLLT